MTKILAIGDFHGKISAKIFEKIKKIQPDLIISPGDFCGDKLLGKIFFKHFYGKSEEEQELVSEKIKRSYEELERKAINSGEEVIKKLKKLNIPIYAIRGNWDPAPFGKDITLRLDKNEKKSIHRFVKLQNSNFQFVDLRALEFKEFILIGGASSTSPIGIKKDSVEKMMKKHSLSKKEATKFVALLKHDWNFRQKEYEQMFEKAKKVNKPVIFLTHNCPFQTKLDKIKKGPQKGKHYGSYQEKLIIKKYQPALVICGHMHENFGEDKIGKSRIINCGSATEGKFIKLSVGK